MVIGTNPSNLGRLHFHHSNIPFFRYLSGIMNDGILDLVKKVRVMEKLKRGVLGRAVEFPIAEFPFAVWCGLNGNQFAKFLLRDCVQ